MKYLTYQEIYDSVLRIAEDETLDICQEYDDIYGIEATKLASVIADFLTNTDNSFRFDIGDYCFRLANGGGAIIICYEDTFEDHHLAYCEYDIYPSKIENEEQVKDFVTAVNEAWYYLNHID